MGGVPGSFPLHGTLNGSIQGDITLWDTARLSIMSKMDIPAGEQEDLDIAVRCDSDSDAYGFNNESYQFAWKHKRWKLPKNRYLVEVTVRSSGHKVSQRFLMNNDLSRDEFRLEPCK